MSFYNAPAGSDYKMEEELSMHIRKAITPEETAPKQKHVRACIVYTWDLRSSGSFWVQLKNQPVLGDEIMTFKAIITFHKVVKDGHPQVLKDGISEAYWLDTLVRGISHMGNRGYVVVIKSYVQFLQAKLNFHRIHPAFNGSFDYEEYVSLRGIEDPNEGFETISELLDLLNKLDVFQKIVFSNLRTGFNNECRIAALVPLVEESYGIYQFLVSMLTAMHQIIGSVEVLAPLREKFNVSHYALFKFYFECSNIRYLTSLITIPKISENPPDFLAQGPPTKQPKSKQPAKSPLDDVDVEQQRKMLQEYEMQRLDRERQEQARLEQQQFEERQRQLELQRQMELQRQQEELQRQIELQRQQELLRQQEEEKMRLMQMQQQNALKHMESQMLQQRALELQRELDAYKSQSLRDRGVLEETNLKMKALENQLAQMSLQNQSNSNKDETIKNLQDELSQWKQKYEALAKLYAQLRKEHLDLLTKFKEIKDSNNKVADEIRKDSDKLKSELNSKTNELTNVLVERDRLKTEADRIRQQYEERIQRLERELKDSADSMMSISKSKGDEMQNLVQKFNSEKSSLERLLADKQNILNDYAQRLELANAELQKMQMQTQQESTVLQAGLDQTLVAFANLKKVSAENEQNLMSQISKLQTEHLTQLNKMMDNILQHCVTKVDEAIFELQDHAHEGNVTASPEYALTLVEKAQNSCMEFANSFIRLVQGGDQSESITTSNTFANSIIQLLFNVKGITRLAQDDETTDNVIRVAHKAAYNAKQFFLQMKSASLLEVDPNTRPSYIKNLGTQTQHSLESMVSVIESLVPEEVGVIAATSVEDISDVVEREMRNAANAISLAAQKLQSLLPSTNLHSSIIDAAKILTSAILILIQRATESQQEIVMHGRGATTSGAFYKKNNKWTEGLISAAKSVAEATTYLVECADGLVNGNRTMEQLIVSAQEVSVATTQLVAASRVKAVPFSKTQDRLEDAAVKVKDATKQLVKAAKEAAKRSAEEQVLAELKSTSRHQYKVIEMEQQVKILELEKDLQNARYKLAEIRRSGYNE